MEFSFSISTIVSTLTTASEILEYQVYCPFHTKKSSTNRYKFWKVDVLLIKQLYLYIRICILHSKHGNRLLLLGKTIFSQKILLNAFNINKLIHMHYRNFIL